MNANFYLLDDKTKTRIKFIKKNVIKDVIIRKQSNPNKLYFIKYGDKMTSVIDTDIISH